MFKPRSRTTKFGVKRIVRDNYGGLKWYDTIKEIHKRDGDSCMECGVYLGKAKGEIHHIKPLSRGGTTTKANLTKLCKDCHDGKHRHLAARRR